MANIPANWVRRGFVAAFRAQRVPITESHVGVTDNGPLTTFLIRIGWTHDVLPSHDWIEKAIDAERVEPGSLEGAKYCLIGAVQTAGGRARVTARILQTETAVVVTAAKADAAASSAGLTAAITSALATISKHFFWGGPG
jgi:hypothetical protein